MKKKSILIVDDDASIRAALKRVLEHSGYEVLLACDGVEAQPLIAENLADLIILDLDMPRRDGWDVLEEMQARLQRTPVIVVTGFWDQLATYRINGAASLMSKPVDAQTLLDEIEDVLAGHSGNQAFAAQACAETHVLLRPTPSCPVPASPATKAMRKANSPLGDLPSCV